jgi:predicted DNA-binding protein (UPF0251 family)
MFPYVEGNIQVFPAHTDCKTAQMTRDNHESHDWEAVPVEEAIDRIVTAGLLTERQAEAYVLREIESVPRQAAADHMKISVNTLDKRLGEARRKVEHAEETVNTIDNIRYRPIPEECPDCGKPLFGRWSTNETGTPVCLDCAAIDA